MKQFMDLRNVGVLVVDDNRNMRTLMVEVLRGLGVRRVQQAASSAEGLALVVNGLVDVIFADVFAGLRAANYSGGVYVELSRHSYDAVNTARKAKAFLDPFLTGG